MTTEHRYDVLDHGYIKFVESWGSDERIIEAARMSTGKGFLGWGPKHQSNCSFLQKHPNLEYDTCDCARDVSGDEKLLAFLYENRHDTPFEMAGMVVEVQAPIMVFREWHRHRTQSYNEMSARYTPLPDLNYVPTVARLMANANGTNRQANRADGAPVLTEQHAQDFRETIQAAYEYAESFYQQSLAAGVPKELARLVLPVGRYSRMRASAYLRNWLGFLTLRNAPNAQYEIREYAIALQRMLTTYFPRTLALYTGGRR